ncbi:MAG: peptidase M75 [Bacteroidales bacterium]|nr:peptidase M75 [Bacteroidales bacterium]
MFTVLSVSTFVSCSDDDNNDNPFAEREAALSPAVAQYVSNTVVATYQSLADATIELHTAIETLKTSKTQSNLNAATQKWISARKYWELSEAFLFGAAGDFGIDPHIDTWPLGEPAFIALMNNSTYINFMDAEDGDVWASDNLGSSLLGFHGIEFILFENGKSKDVSKVKDNELIYALAVAGDLRNQCVRLEVAWAGIDAVTSDKKELVEDLDLQVCMQNGSSYGEDMLTAGKAGSTYKTVTAAAVAVIAGCIDISDEVGEVKIGTAYSKDDVTYIESPYSFNSKVDFADNIRSIENAYIGGVEGKRGASISEYVKGVDAELDATLKAAIANAIAKIDAIPYPFAQNYTSAEAGVALAACQELTATLEDVKALLQK